MKNSRFLTNFFFAAGIAAVHLAATLAITPLKRVSAAFRGFLFDESEPDKADVIILLAAIAVGGALLLFAK